MQRDKMKAAIDTIYGKVFNEGRGDLLPSLMAGPYIQHNPMFPDGTDFVVNFLKQVKKVPCEVKRIAIDGDLAFIHVRYLDWGGKETAGVDIFRFDSDGKILEHWDVLQPVPESANNTNGMF
jgi:predicted SnoaL-like aldol condensation-catalyzing enzyme